MHDLGALRLGAAERGVEIARLRSWSHHLAVPAQAYVASFLATFKEFPQRQKAASFNLDEVMEKMRTSGGSK